MMTPFETAVRRIQTEARDSSGLAVKLLGGSSPPGPADFLKAIHELSEPGVRINFLGSASHDATVHNLQLLLDGYRECIRFNGDHS